MKKIRRISKEYLLDINNKRGITLIALVITIIVMMLLVGITFLLATKKNGVVKNANKAKKAYNIEQQAEVLKMAIAGVEAEHSEEWLDDENADSFYTKDNINKFLGDEGRLTEEPKYENGKLVFSYLPQGSDVVTKFNLDDDGNVSYASTQKLMPYVMVSDNDNNGKYSVGDEVKYIQDDEKFFIIKKDSTTTTLLSKYCLNRAGTIQQNDDYYNISVSFSSVKYWDSIDNLNLNKYPIPSTQSSNNNAIVKARDYGSSHGGTGRLLTVWETNTAVINLDDDGDEQQEDEPLFETDDMRKILYGNYDGDAKVGTIGLLAFWLATTESTWTDAEEIAAIPSSFTYQVGYVETVISEYSDSSHYGVRPVVEVPNSSF